MTLAPFAFGVLTQESLETRLTPRSMSGSLSLAMIS
jgi:hypothetical protein